MILSEKLLVLRTRAGLSQEELAEKLNVSRQSVSKWETNAIPNIDKILDIAAFYGVSTDYLLKDDMEDLPGEIVADVYRPEDVREISMETAMEYLSVVKESGKRIALGVALCIFSPVAMMSFVGMSELGVLLGIVAIAVILFILNGLRLEEYDYLEKEEFKLSYGVAGIVEKEEKEYRPIFYRGIAFGAAMCVISCIPIVIVGAADAPDGTEVCMCGLLLVLVAIGVYAIVRVAVRKGGYERLLQQGDYTQEKKRINMRLEVFDGAYWGLITTIYLGVSLSFHNWGVSWIIWPVAGVAFMAIRPIVVAIRGKSE